MTHPMTSEAYGEAVPGSCNGYQLQRTFKPIANDDRYSSSSSILERGRACFQVVRRSPKAIGRTSLADLAETLVLQLGIGTQSSFSSSSRVHLRRFMKRPSRSRLEAPVHGAFPQRDSSLPHQTGSALARPKQQVQRYLSRYAVAPRRGGTSSSAARSREGHCTAESAT